MQTRLEPQRVKQLLTQARFYYEYRDIVRLQLEIVDAVRVVVELSSPTPPLVFSNAAKTVSLVFMNDFVDIRSSEETLENRKETLRKCLKKLAIRTNILSLTAMDLRFVSALVF